MNQIVPIRNVPDGGASQAPTGPDMTAQDTLFAWGCQRYPAVAGFKARQTSRAAAQAISGRSRQLQARVLAVLEQGNATADECAARMGESILAVRPRCTELFRLWQVEDSGERRRNRSGRNAIVWRTLP